MRPLLVEEAQDAHEELEMPSRRETRLSSRLPAPREFARCCRQRSSSWDDGGCRVGCRGLLRSFAEVRLSLGALTASQTEGYMQVRRPPRAEAAFSARARRLERSKCLERSS